MIISASRRTDIPAFYSEWFFRRLEQRFALTRNPMNFNQVRRVSLEKDAVDCFVFWSKNPRPMLGKLSALSRYTYYFQFTLNCYGEDIESGLPAKRELIDTFKALSDAVGKERVIWRYDPILLNENYNIGHHIESFSKMAEALRGSTEKVTLSFIDYYRKIEKNVAKLNIRCLNHEEKRVLAKALSETARENGMRIDSCSEDINLEKYGIEHARCIDAELIERLSGKSVPAKKDKNQRIECGCVASVDIGAYNSCLNGCAYCYANYSEASVEKNRKAHNVNSPLLIGEPDGECSRVL